MISATILVKNGERKLQKVLTSLKDFPEVILFDTGSTDKTLTIAASFANVKIVEGLFNGFGPSHNIAASYASNDWVLSIDADEILSPLLAQEILSTTFENQCVYSLIFHNFYRQKWIKGCGWHPESHVRIYNRKLTAFSEAKVHEGVITKNFKIITLKNPVYHYPYETVSDFLIKMERYSNLFAEQYKGKKRSSCLKALRHGAWAFFKSYFIKKGFLMGSEGLMISSYNAHTAYYKYLKLKEANANSFNVSQDR